MIWQFLSFRLTKQREQVAMPWEWVGSPEGVSWVMRARECRKKVTAAGQGRPNPIEGPTHERSSRVTSWQSCHEGRGCFPRRAWGRSRVGNKKL